MRRVHETRETTGAGGAGGARLHRQLGLAGLTFISLGSVIGSGWLLGALTAAEVAGPASVVSWAIAGALVALLALVYAELGAAYPVAGGTARYPQLVLGPLGGFVAGWVAWIPAVALAPLEVTAALSYLDHRFPGLVDDDGTLTRSGLALAAAALIVFTAVNLLGVRWLARTNTVTVGWKVLVPAVTVVALTATAFHPANFQAGGGFAPFGAKGVFTALPAGVVFSLQGFEQAVQMGAEAKRPHRDLPRAIIVATLAGTALYFLLQVAFIAAVEPARLAAGWSRPLGTGDYGPYATLATNLGLGWLAILLYIDAVVSPGGTALIYLGTSARLSYSLARTRSLPAVLARLDRRGVPIVSVLLAAAVGMVVLLPFPSWQNLVRLVSSATFVMYGFAPVCLAVLRRADPDRFRPYRLPAARILAPLGFAAANLVIYWAGWRTNQKLFAAIAVGLAVFGGYQATRPAGRRPDLEWRAAWWIAPWLGGLAVLSWLGQFGGRGVLPFWVDLAVVAGFALVVFAAAVRAAVSTGVGRRRVEIARIQTSDAAGGETGGGEIEGAENEAIPGHGPPGR
ncbi:amino acid/polyamine/organocation transporter, APC superfamily [Frankia torreyi]|uniref:Amino acid/polyamine/organocation transporter, APC superfamily n=2 Tax=Frankia TaxID=1854 RepID=A0A0D8B801_9ACTN|nr:APC family permease [Frankia torreyi]KJE20408.1 amino acid/polyamine/organocation transporter, APC superfamily [Frankia torreyi]